MSGEFTTVDLSKLPAPIVVEQISFEAIKADILAEYVQRHPEFSALVESDPIFKFAEVVASREVQVRQRANESSVAVMLAKAVDADLDNIAANFNVARRLITPANPDALPPTVAVYESDAELRRRVQLAWEGLSVAGPDGAYIFHALSADADVLDASVSSPTPGDVVVTVLSRTGDGTASAPLLAAVEAVLLDDDVRPLTDSVTVAAAAIVNYTVDAALTLYPGPDSAVVVAEAIARVDAYIAASKRLGRNVTRFGILGALAVEGVQNVALAQPATDVVVTAAQAAHCTARAITVAGTDE